jgi:hypothetical protein
MQKLHRSGPAPWLVKPPPHRCQRDRCDPLTCAAGVVLGFLVLTLSLAVAAREASLLLREGLCQQERSHVETGGEHAAPSGEGGTGPRR